MFKEEGMGLEPTHQINDEQFSKLCQYQLWTYPSLCCIRSRIRTYTPFGNEVLVRHVYHSIIRTYVQRTRELNPHHITWTYLAGKLNKPIFDYPLYAEKG